MSSKKPADLTALNELAARSMTRDELRAGFVDMHAAAAA